MVKHLGSPEYQTLKPLTTTQLYEVAVFSDDKPKLNNMQLSIGNSPFILCASHLYPGFYYILLQV